MKRLVCAIGLILTMALMFCACGDKSTNEKLRGSWQGEDGYVMSFDPDSGTGTQENTIRGTESSFTYEITEFDGYAQLHLNKGETNELVLTLKWLSNAEFTLDWAGAQIEKYTKM